MRLAVLRWNRDVWRLTPDGLEEALERIDSTHLLELAALDAVLPVVSNARLERMLAKVCAAIVNHSPFRDRRAAPVQPDDLLPKAEPIASSRKRPALDQVVRKIRGIAAMFAAHQQKQGPQTGRRKQ